MDPMFVDAALGFRIQSGQVQFIEDGRVTRVRPASHEEAVMYATLVAGESQWPVQGLDLAC